MLILGMIVRDEASMLRWTQPCMRTWHGPRIALDFESRDDTADRLASEGWIVLPGGPWPNDYSRARNLLLSKLRGEFEDGWMLQLDADEIMEPIDLLRLSLRLNSWQHNVFAFPRYNYAAQGTLVTSSYPDWQARCVRLPSGVKWSLPVHEVINESQQRLPNQHIHHYGWEKSPQSNWLRSHNYERIAKGLPPLTAADIPDDILCITYDAWLADMKTRHTFLPCTHEHPLKGRL